MKIQIKVLLIVFTLLLISGFVTILVNQTVSKNVLEQAIYDNLECVAKSRANHIETLLNEYKQTAERMATGNSFRNIVDPSKDYNQSIEQVNRRINTIIQSTEDISRVRVLDKKRIVVASSHTDISQNKSAAEIFLKGKEGVYIGDLHISNFTGNIVIRVAAPILVNGEFSGVIIVDYDAERGLFKITTDRTGLGETGGIYLINKDGYMITPSRFINDTFRKQKINTDSTRDWFRAIEIFEAHEHEAVIYKIYLGTEVLRVQVPIPMMGWYLVAEISDEEAFAPIAELTRRMLSILALILVIGVAVSIVLSRTITKPILELHHGVEEIEKGNMDFKVGTKAEDEIGQLSRAFDSMTAELKKSRAELEEYSSGLEEKVEERTNELADKVKESEEQANATLNLLEDVNETKNELEASRQAILNMVHDLETEKREAENAKEMLAAANVKLERSNKELWDFAYIASHDLREPLRKISAFGQLLQESLKGKLDEDEEENFAFMIDGATRMQQMIDDLLVYSRVSTKAKPPERVDLNAVIDDLKNVELAVQVEETGGVINVPEPLPPLHADPSQIHQLLQNLLGNGLKYCRKGVPPVITVRGRVVNGNTVRIEVQDNGIGIEEQYCANIFGMFKRLHSREDYEGSGIGLAVCKKIVERPGGKIGVESNPGVGSTFWFTVPITIDELQIQRNRWDVMSDILEEISWEGGVQKTNLDWKSVKSYFDFLMDNGFLEAGDEPGKGESYKLTEKGQDLLLKLQTVAEMIR
uniref:histidine kinase n=1 Tax=Candidatus Methanophaga sp. ANME-1 ERB7 TaxID=2759913 RepID=A0A7G9Z4X2_9EURY|nr:adaptive-response sensory-kinase SasA [Methanosarcinales archaeon ANME-1 ERB7]